MDIAEVNHYRKLIIGVTTVILVLAFASYALRIWARRVSGAKLWYDDFFMGIGLVWR